eukprot:1809100-Prymnesium_polylepis.1
MTEPVRSQARRKEAERCTTILNSKTAARPGARHPEAVREEEREQRRTQAEVAKVDDEGHRATPAWCWPAGHPAWRSLV